MLRQRIAGLNAGEDMELRMAGALPRSNAVKHVHEKYGVNMLATICAIDRAALPAAMEYWVPEVDTTGMHRTGGQRPDSARRARNETTDLRGEPLPGMEE